MTDAQLLGVFDGLQSWFANSRDSLAVYWQRAVQCFAAPDARLVAATVMLTIGLYAFMSGARRGAIRILSAVVGGLGVATLLSLVPASTMSVDTISFAMIASLTIVAAVGTVSSKSPIYCAIWFAVTLFGVGSLFLVNGAQFLGIATVAVYAGAIVVTFLFVLMLAQPDGHTHYDRISWGVGAQWIGCFAGAACACALVWAFLNTPLNGTGMTPAENPILVDAHVAALGATMFSRYLLAVEIAGLLLFAALVGAVSIAATSTSAASSGATPTGKFDRQIDRAISGRTSAGSVQGGKIPHE